MAASDGGGVYFVVFGMGADEADVADSPVTHRIPGFVGRCGSDKGWLLPLVQGLRDFYRGFFDFREAL